MIKKRIIFTFYYYEGYFVQSRNFSLQKVGDIDWIKKNFNLEKISNFIDEVAIVNLSKKVSHKNFLTSLKELSKYFLIEVTFNMSNSFFFGKGKLNLKIKELFLIIVPNLPVPPVTTILFL